MSDWSFGESVFVSSFVPGGQARTGGGGSAGGGRPGGPTGGAAVAAPAGRSQPAVPVTAEWRKWIAENLLMRQQPASLVEAMVRDGIDRATAVAEVQAAIDHPYLHAARGVGAAGGAAGGATAGGMNATHLESRLKKREWVLELYRRTARQATTYGQVARVRRPSRQQFLDEYYAANRPVVIEGAMDDWPALTRWMPDELKRRFGDRVVEVQANRESDAEYEINSSRHKKSMPFGEYVDTIEKGGETNNYYMTANNSGRNTETLKELWDDIVLFPEYLRSDDPSNRGFFWYGPKGTVTPLHHDLTNNFMAQVRGRKLCRLVAPYDTPYMYNHRHCYSRIDLDRVDYDRFPLFREAKVIDVTIGPGDMLFLPIGWWHYVRGLDVTITMTFTNFVFDNDFYSFYTTYNDV